MVRRVHWRAKLTPAINNSYQAAIHNMPFFLNYGQRPLTHTFVNMPQYVPKAHNFTEGMLRAVKEAKGHLGQARKSMNTKQTVTCKTCSTHLVISYCSIQNTKNLLGTSELRVRSSRLALLDLLQSSKEW